MSERYNEAAARLQAKVKTYLKENTEDILSSDEEEPVDESVLEGVLLNYCSQRGDSQLLQRTRHQLEETLNGKNITCLICISSIRRIDAIWNCTSCYSSFHLSCIQKWANDSVSIKVEPHLEPVQVVSPLKLEWDCPKCRHAYSKDEIPRKYMCFCGKTDNPPLHPWMVPHSCGDKCHKLLTSGGKCQHRCLLLCHPGRCPPCPQTMSEDCYCGGERKPVRCSAAAWSCGKICNKLLFCNSHKCENVCHEGDCTPCSVTNVQACFCGAKKTVRPCYDKNWQCTKVCGKPYSCGHHICEKVCHSGDCGDCPKNGLQSCPCGAEKGYVICPNTLNPCLGTCEKPRTTCNHSCVSKCHKGPCPPCIILQLIECNCKRLSKDLPCHRTFKCDNKCEKLRSCKKHNCGKKCCDGNCPPCEKICDKPLQCGRHKCTMVCHSGPCYPCPLESKVTCRCKQSVFLVPCGGERYVKPPKCNYPCKLKYKCGHNSENKHSCHFGDCPPCNATCNKTYEKCKHKCEAPCHKGKTVVFKQVQKPATPCEVQGPKTKILDLDCPPCKKLVTYKCFGEHETTEQLCHLASRLDCGRECGRPLSCGNHNCSLQCHLLVPDENFPHNYKECEECKGKCTQPRPENCKHRCSIQSCHRGPCPPCEIHERLKCHCGLTEYYILCKELNTVTEDFLTCKQQCSKNLECGHRCKKFCHAGPCKDQICTKKVKTYCKCGNVKKEFPCVQVRSGETKVECDASCKNKELAEILEKEQEENRRKLMEEEKNRKELEEYEKKFTKKRKHKEKKKLVAEDNRNWLQKNWISIASALTVVIGATCFYYFTINYSNNV